MEITNIIIHGQCAAGAFEFSVIPPLYDVSVSWVQGDISFMDFIEAMVDVFSAYGIIPPEPYLDGLAQIEETCNGTY